MRGPTLTGLVLAALLAAPASAQGPHADDARARLDTTWLGASLLTAIEAPIERLEAAAAVPAALSAHGFVGDTTLPCLEFECAEPGTRHKRFWRAFGELMIVQAIPNIFSRLGDKEWAKFTTQSWADNLKYPWQWDNNAFLNNQFSHPYHGSLYFNAARTNGYNFWASVPWAFGGSLMWEIFGEVWVPADATIPEGE